MRPKTKKQKEVVELSKTLPPISEKQKEWAFKTTLNEQFFSINKFRNKYHAYCYECGNRWEQEPTLITTLFDIKCPCCGKVLKKRNVEKATFKISEYFAILTICGGWQVVRMCYATKKMQKQQPAQFIANEVMQHWISPDGEVITFSILAQTMTMYYDQWCLDSEMELRGLNSNKAILRYNLSPYRIYPERKVLPILKRNGFKGFFHGVAPHIFFSSLLKSSKTETLLKSKQYALLKYNIESPLREELWGIIKICIRNFYTITDASVWIDYISLLQYFGKDLRNPKYVCPLNLKEAHDRLVAKKRDIERKMEVNRLKQRIAKLQKKYEASKGKFFGLEFKDKSLLIRPIERIEDFMAEGDELKHCVFTNQYFSKPDSLVFTATIDGKRMETIEVSLKSFEVLQARGMRNSHSKHHDRILGLVKKNIPSIAARIADKPKSKLAV